MRVKEVHGPQSTVHGNAEKVIRENLDRSRKGVSQSTENARIQFGGMQVNAEGQSAVCRFNLLQDVC
jgi:hypothetical protein